MGTIASSRPIARVRRRAIDRPPFRGTDLLFGVLLPITCFFFDAGLADSSIARGLSIAMPFIRVEIVVFAAALVLAPEAPWQRAALAGALAPGAVVAGAIGLLLLPLAVPSVLFVIGLLGLVPLGTSWVFARASRAWLRAARGPERRDVLAPFAAGTALALLPLAVTTAGAAWTGHVLSRVGSDLSYPIESAAKSLRWVPDARLDAIVERWGSDEDPERCARFDALHEELGRGSAESRWHEIND